ncbi:MAG: NUDIX hydrolase [Bifidobacterium sp.]|nr:NUDIX hydrolase [Bifidobacterium sp.]MCH4209095.1 NUDIX hydrolase [Bifidobacterium sp.]MCI1224724.1 NUDIX hydrolase [Bifidobacterium sp.]
MQPPSQSPEEILSRHGSKPRSPLDDIELCVVHRPKYDDWSWPKGKLEPNESHRHAAVREMGEETGVAVALGPRLGEIEYPLNAEGDKGKRAKAKNGSTKHVVYWMAQPIGEETTMMRSAALGPVAPADAGEIDSTAWVGVQRARRLLSHAQDRDMLDLFVDRAEEGALRSRALLIVRHGRAEARKQWKGSDAERPITPKGAAAAYALNRELACYAPMRLVTSPWVRCLETIEVFSWQTGLPMMTADELTEDAFAENPQAACERIDAEINRLLSGAYGAQFVTARHRAAQPQATPRPQPPQPSASAQQLITSQITAADSAIRLGDATSCATISSTAASPNAALQLATAICMHRPVIGGVFDHLRAMCASQSLSKQLIASSPYMPTGNAVALFIVETADGPRIIDIQRMAPLVY